MEKQYKLLKDLPGLRAGVIFVYDEEEGGFVFCLTEVGGEGEYWFTQKEINNNPDWFEEVKVSGKIKKGTIMVSQGDGLTVVYTGPGRESDEFSGVVIGTAEGNYEPGTYSKTWCRKAFKVSPSQLKNGGWVS